MTVVLVHGNPETEAVWGPLVDALGRQDVVRLSPPGFGAPLPEGFPATYLAYRDWLEDELEGFDEPVDLVGLFDPDYVWHDLAQVWQTPGDGEHSWTPCWAARVRNELNGWSRSGYLWKSPR